MVKELIDITVERDSLQQKFGFVVQGGSDLALTAKIASVKVNVTFNFNWISGSVRFDDLFASTLVWPLASSVPPL